MLNRDAVTRNDSGSTAAGIYPEGSKGDRLKNIRKPKNQMLPVVRVKPVVIISYHFKNE